MDSHNMGLIKKHDKNSGRLRCELTFLQHCSGQAYYSRGGRQGVWGGNPREVSRKLSPNFGRPLTLRLLNALNSEDRGLKVRFSLATIAFDRESAQMSQILSSQGKNAPSNPHPHYLVRLATSRKEYLNQRGTKIRVFRVRFRAPFPPTIFPHFSPLFPLQALFTLPPLLPSSPPPLSPLF